MKTEIKETVDGRYEVTVYIDHQSFSLESKETKKEAEFFSGQFKIAIERLKERSYKQGATDAQIWGI